MMSSRGGLSPSTYMYAATVATISSGMTSPSPGSRFGVFLRSDDESSWFSLSMLPSCRTDAELPHAIDIIDILSHWPHVCTSAGHRNGARYHSYDPPPSAISRPLGHRPRQPAPDKV